MGLVGVYFGHFYMVPGATVVQLSEENAKSLPVWPNVALICPLNGGE
jgi:hypothetical protein